MGKGMAGHESAAMQKDEWLTPPEILRALGGFDLDPCSPVKRPWDTARVHYTIKDNGIVSPWFGRVWCNPPYGRHTGIWLEKCVKHGNAIALIYARTETKTFHEYVWKKADGILFFKGRLKFYHASGERAKHCGGAPSCLVAYGPRNAEALKDSGLSGHIVLLERIDKYHKNVKKGLQDV